MNKLRIISYPAIAALLFGCAAMTERDKTVERLNTQVAQIKQSLDDTNARLDELNNKFNLLSDKLEAASPVAAPQGLKVVKLGEGGEARTAETLKPVQVPPPQAPQEAKTAKQAPAEVKEAPSQPAPATVEAPAQAPVGEDAMYAKSIDLIHERKYAEARASFVDFLKTYPSSHLAGNAYYWIGETYYTDKDFSAAIEKFGVVPERFPKSNKAPDALLKIGYSYIELHENGKARETLQTLVKLYPQSEAAGKAKKTLENLLASPSKKRK